MIRRQTILLFVFFILTLLVFSCELWDPIIIGCTTSSACNFNPDAKEDDSSCIDPIGCNNWCPDDTTQVQELDCAGVCGGVLFIDCTGQCGILGLDICGVCGGNGNSCFGCTDFPACNYNATATILDHSCWYPDDGCKCSDGMGADLDVCGVCGGDGNCEGVDCTNNTSGYCQDLSVLQEFIENSLETINMGMDDNGNGIIEPLELGSQSWSNGRLTSFHSYPSELSGEIPSNIGTLTNLISLELAFNQLTGSIPPEIGNLVNLTYLDLSNNQLAGSIPSEIGNLVNLLELLLSTNQLEGEIPSTIENLTKLYTLDLGSNQFSGTMPDEIWHLETLNILWLYTNKFTGKIQPEIENLRNLFSLKLHSNEFTGTIPNEICNLDLEWEGQYAKINDNKLCPEYPSCIIDYIGNQDCP